MLHICSTSWIPSAETGVVVGSSPLLTIFLHSVRIHYLAPQIAAARPPSVPPIGRFPLQPRPRVCSLLTLQPGPLHTERMRCLVKAHLSGCGSQPSSTACHEANSGGEFISCQGPWGGFLFELVSDDNAPMVHWPAARAAWALPNPGPSCDGQAGSRVVVRHCDIRED